MLICDRDRSEHQVKRIARAHADAPLPKQWSTFSIGIAQIKLCDQWWLFHLNNCNGLGDKIIVLKTGDL